MTTHDGYEPSHGILHHRHIFLATGGGNLRGADILEYTGAGRNTPPRRGAVSPASPGDSGYVTRPARVAENPLATGPAGCFVQMP